MDIVTITSEMWTARIAPGLGGNIVSLNFGNKEILCSRENAIGSFTFGMPMLLPANRTANGEFAFDGKIYNLPINDNVSGANLHGMLNSVEFRVISETDNMAELMFINTNTIYPFPLSINVIYSLYDGGLKTTHKIKNMGSSPMPLTFGLHTTFYKPSYFRVPIKLNQERDSRNMPTGRYIELSDQQKSYRDGIDPSNVTISGYYSSDGNEAYIDDITYRVDEHFNHWVLYKPSGESDFLCIEPMVGAVNGLNIENGSFCIDKGDVLELHTSLQVNVYSERHCYGNK